VCSCGVRPFSRSSHADRGTTPSPWLAHQLIAAGMRRHEGSQTQAASEGSRKRGVVPVQKEPAPIKPMHTLAVLAAAS